MSGATTVEAAGDPNSSVQDWASEWRSQASTTICGTCLGGACGICSIRVGGDPKVDGLPTGYVPRVLQLYKPDEIPVSAINNFDMPSFAPEAATPGLVRGSATGSTAAPAANVVQPNAIVLENMKQGSPESEWLIGVADSSIEGFAAQFTINHGNRVDFKINTDSTHYRIDIYRLGYYGGDGARKVKTIEQTLDTAQVQPLPLFDPDRKLVDAGNWSVSASWDIPADAVSGIYFAKLTRLDGGGDSGENMIPFIVRDDEAPSDITFQTSDTTWQAYNWWGGYNFYGGVDQGGREGRASAVSYNRPIITRDGGFAAGPQDFIFGAEYPAIRWLEQNGYDINYISGIDAARDGAQLLNSKVFLSVGHDEYWSAEQRDNVEAARDAGVNLAFLSGNEVYWQTRWETSIDGTGTPYKTLVSYKERWDNDNTDVNGTTSTWRDPQFGAGEPENALTGTMFTVDSYRLDTIQIPYDLSNFRFWSNTDVADIDAGEVYSLVPNLLGYEWDSDVDNGHRPDGLIALSSTSVDVNTLLLDYGSTTGAGTATHSLTLYRAPSGALVFGAGTVYWVWGLDDNHDLEATPTDPNVQQAMVNLFADMGVQPETLMTSLMLASQTTDHTKPTSVITSPTSSGSYTAAQTIVITGTATDSGGGSVAVVEVSTDGGTTWHRATGFENWSYTWTPLAGGTYTIMSRAVDDSVNLETPSAGMTIDVAAAPTYSFFSSSAVPATLAEDDRNWVNLGVRFTSSQAGTIVGLKYYKGLGDGGIHVGSLWSATGTLIASATFTGESASGWQTVIFSNPVSISAGTAYVASYFSRGFYASTADYFATSQTSGPLTAQAGYYAYGADQAFPTFESDTNYWIDVIFSPTNTANEAPIGTNDNGYTVAQNATITFAASTLLANDSDPNGDLLSITGVGAASGGTVSFDSQTNIITFTPNAGYTGPAIFGYAISDGRGGIGSAMVNLTVLPPSTSVSLFSSTSTPADSVVDSAVNLGMRFVTSTSGTISGIKFYKAVGETGTHTGSLWSATGTLLASATFINETASGWQSVTFSNPISISAGTTYIVSYNSNGRYVVDSNYFNTAHVNGPLTAPAADNGLFTYGSGSAFPTSTYGGSNYWVDVLFDADVSPTNDPPVANDDGGFSATRDIALAISASALLSNDTDPNNDTLTITGVSNGVNGTVSFNAQTNIITFTPNAGYTGAASFDYSVSDGRNGSATATVDLTVNVPSTSVSLFSSSDTPANLSVSDAVQVNLGMRFIASVDGTITGIRYYKGVLDTGTHTGSLWTSSGTLLATATFTNETSSGWQQLNFLTPVTITAGTTYVASYHSNGRYTATSGYFGTAITNGPLTAPGGNNGLYAYGTDNLFPSDSFGATNYWVDVLFNPSAPPVNQSPIAADDSGFTTTRNVPITISAADLLANDSDPDNDSLTISGVGGATNGSVSFNSQTNLITFTPTAGYTGAASFGYSISDGRNGTASANVALTVDAATVTSLFNPDYIPSIAVTDTISVELGVKFQASSNGDVLGIRFYKSVENTGPHVANLWTANGSLLGTAIFTNETASGWQEAFFNTPITITAGTTYVASYHSNGNYSADPNFFATSHTNGALMAPSSSSSGGNGVFAYGSSSLFPENTYNSNNYGVDVLFRAQLSA